MTNHNDTPTPRFLTPEQITRLATLVDGAIFGHHVAPGVRSPQ
jgi:hypothetical protein